MTFNPRSGRGHGHVIHYCILGLQVVGQAQALQTLQAEAAVRVTDGRAVVVDDPEHVDDARLGGDVTLDHRARADVTRDVRRAAANQLATVDARRIYDYVIEQVTADDVRTVANCYIPYFYI